MHHPRLKEWERKLYNALEELDDFLENQYGSLYNLHPARPARGKTSRKLRDGLVDLSANFSLGIGSQHGRGYVIKVDLVTLENVPENIQMEIESAAEKKLRELLPAYFPETELRVERDRHVIKVFGDLSLGKL